MRLIIRKPQWDHTVTGRKGRASGKGRGAPDQVRNREKASRQGPTHQRGWGWPCGLNGAGGDPDKNLTAANSRAAAHGTCYHP